MSAQLDALTQEVANATTIEQSAVTLIQGLAAQLAAAGTDPAKLQALHDQLLASDTALANAVTTNTGGGVITGVVVSPAIGNVGQGATLQFTVAVAGDPNNSVAWSLNPAGVGSISNSGLYTPPTTPGGSVQVIATSTVNPTKSGSANVTF